MTKTDIEETIYEKCEGMCGSIFLKDNMPLEEVHDERIIIIVGNTTSSKIWYETQVKVNWCIPDIHDEPDTPKVKLAEEALRDLHYGLGEKDGLYYRFKESSADIFADSEMRCHIVNITLKFQHQKLMNYE